MMGLVSVSEDFEVQKIYMRFIIKTLQIFDEEVVERSSEKAPAWTAVSKQIKDFVRAGAITDIINVLQ